MQQHSKFTMQTHKYTLTHIHDYKEFYLKERRYINSGSYNFTFHNLPSDAMKNIKAEESKNLSILFRNFLM